MKLCWKFKTRRHVTRDGFLRGGGQRDGALAVPEFWLRAEEIFCRSWSNHPSPCDLPPLGEGLQKKNLDLESGREGRRNINIILCCSLFVRQYHFEQYGSCIIQQGFGEFQTLRFAIDKILRILWLSRVSEILITFTTNWEQSFITLKDSFAGIEKVCRLY